MDKGQAFLIGVCLGAILLAGAQELARKCHGDKKEK